MTRRPMSPRQFRHNLPIYLHHGRIPRTSVLTAAIVSCCLGLFAPATRACADDKSTSDPSRKLFKQYCQTCHSGAKPKGDFRVDSLSQAFTDKAIREQWQNVVEQL